MECTYVAVPGSPKVLVVRVYLLSVHCRQSVWAAGADRQPSRAAAAGSVRWITGRPALHGAADSGAARREGDRGGGVVQPARVPAHVSQHPAGGCRRQWLPVGTGSVAARQQTGSDCVPVWLHSFPCESTSCACIFQPWLNRMPSIDMHGKFYGDRLRGTPPLGDLNARGVVKYSDFWHLECYNLERMQDRR